nr:protection of telomeres protein 1B-like isoform X1 [Ipomoea batatas]
MSWFIPIADAMASLNQKVNLIGVVTESGIQRKSKGTDYYVSIRIVDESRPTPALPVNFFTETMDKLPQGITEGDIIVLSRVMMRIHGPDVYACFNKKFSSFGLYEGKNSTSFEPYQCSDKFCPIEQVNKRIILDLRKWLLAGHQIDAGLTDLLQLKELKEGVNFSLVCKVLHVCETEGDQWMLFVWDGTDTPPVAIKSNLEDEKENPLPLQLEPIPLSRDVLCTFPPVGTVLRVTVDSGDIKLGLNCIKTGRWVKLIGLECEVRSSLWCAVLKSFTKLCYLSDDNDLVLKHERSYNGRFSSRQGHKVLTCFPCHSNLTETSCSRTVPFITLMNVLTYPEVTYKYRCVVRVVATVPCRVSDFRSPSKVYKIRLTLEDPTARIRAFLYKDDAEEFFARFPSPDDALTREWNALLGIPNTDDCSEVGDASRHPPWIDCCLKSYYIDKNDVWGSRYYRIFSTTLVGRPRAGQ